MSRIQAKEKTVGELLRNVKYSIDFYQREYEWERRHVEELLDDFESKFISSYSSEHGRSEVYSYPHYFLGTIITVAENGQSYIVDGQQRLTTLTLLLIYVQHRLTDIDDIGNCRSLIYSAKRGVKSFNINVPERLDCMQALFEEGEYDAADQLDLSVKNVATRYADIVELFPESLQGDTMPYFFDWLIDNVDLVEIKAYADDDAFTIFETMNDRGLSLGHTDMLKGFLLANINDSNEDIVHQRKTQANKVWKRRIIDLIGIGKDEDERFFREWLRAKYARSIRERKKDATNQDFENINKFHRWARDNKEHLGLMQPQDFYDFITQRMNRFAGHFIWLRQAATTLAPGYEEIYYNAHNNFTLQYMLALAPLRLEDDIETAREKMRLVTTFLDIYLARRMVNFRVIGYSTVQYTMFNFARNIRDAQLDQLRELLLRFLEEMPDTFKGINGDHYEPFSLTHVNPRRVHYLLARMTAFVEQGSGNNVSFYNCAYDGKGRPLEIEHIWADMHDRHVDEFPHSYDFQRHRNYFGGLVLLPKGSNASFGADPYEEKLQHYVEENLLAASLHPQKYEKNSSFRNFRENKDLPFKPHPQFKKADLMERQELYRQICEQIWTPDRLLVSS